MVSDTTYTGKDPVREGQDYSCSTPLEESTMVSSPAETFEQNSSDDSNPREHGDITNSTGFLESLN